jgi:hypothetical protein
MSQPAHAAKILALANRSNCNGSNIPMCTRLEKPAEPPSAEEQAAMQLVPYHAVTGALLYLVNCTRPDLAYAVNQLCRFSSAPRLVHWAAAKRVIRYLASTINLGIVYHRDAPDSTPAPVEGWSDADYAGEVTTRRSTSGYAFTLSSAVFAWRCTIQRCVALSTAEAELVALTLATKMAAWLLKLAKDVGADFNSICIGEDNQAAISIASDIKFSERTKHMDVRHFYVREKVADGSITIKYVPSTEQLADIFTKPLAKDAFLRLRHMLGLRPCK